MQDFSWELHTHSNGSPKESLEESQETSQVIQEGDDGDNDNGKEKVEKVLAFLSSQLKVGKDRDFLLEKVGSQNEDLDNQEKDFAFSQVWSPKKVTIKGALFESDNFSAFVPESLRKSWFDLPFKLSPDDKDKDGNSPRKVFRDTHGY